MMVRMRPALMYSSTDSRGILRSRSALTARSRSLGASARARATSSAPLGMLFAGAADDNVSTALMFLSLTRSAPSPRACGERGGVRGPCSYIEGPVTPSPPPSPLTGRGSTPGSRQQYQPSAAERALIVDRQVQPAYLEAGQVTHEKGVHPEPAESCDVAREQRLALLRGQVVAGDRLGRIGLHRRAERMVAQHLAAEIIDVVDRHGSAPAPGGVGVALLHLRGDEFRPPLADRTEHGDPVEQLAADIARAQELRLDRLGDEGFRRALLEELADSFRPVGIGHAVRLAGRDARAEHLEREAAAADHDDAERLAPALDRARDGKPERVAALRGRQRRHVPTHEDRNDRGLHL